MAICRASFWVQGLDLAQVALVKAAYGTQGYILNHKQFTDLLLYYGELQDLLEIMEQSAWLSIMYHQANENTLHITRSKVTEIPPKLVNLFRSGILKVRYYQSELLLEIEQTNSTTLTRPIWFLYYRSSPTLHFEKFILASFTILNVEQELAVVKAELEAKLGGKLDSLEFILNQS